MENESQIKPLNLGEAMSEQNNDSSDVDELYREFESALAEVLNETGFNLDRRIRLAAARARLTSNPHWNRAKYAEAVESAFIRST